MTRLRQITVISSYVFMILLNTLANLLPINGRTTGAISDDYFNLFAPAGFTFSIWGLIYVLLGLYVLRVITRDQESLDPLVQWLFVIINLFNGLWIIAWHYDLIGLSLGLMIPILILLIMASKKLKGEKSLTAVAFLVYLGWITVATVANVTTLLVSLGFNPIDPGPIRWTVLMILVALIIIVITGVYFKSFSYLLVGLWSFSGILSKHLNDFDGRHLEVISVVVVAMMTVIFTLVFLLVMSLQRQKLKK